MLDFVIFAVTFFVVLVAILIYLYPGSRRQTSVDGLDPSDPTDGNFGDIIKAGSFHNFLIDLHQKFGNVASFWLVGPILAISVWSEDLIKNLDYISEKPKEVNPLFESFLGKNSLLFAQKHEFRKQRRLWELMFDSNSIDRQKTTIRQLASELTNKWSTLPDQQHIPVGNYMKALTLRLSLISGFGNYFRKSNSDLIQFCRSFENCFTELEARLLGDSPSDRTNLRNECFEQSVVNCRQILGKAIEDMKNSDSDDPDSGLLTPLITDNPLNTEQVIDESMTYVLMYYSLSSALIWTLFYISSKPELQSQISQKIKVNSEDNLFNKFIDCAISSANVIQWTSRVNLDVDIQVDKHIVQKGTPIICCLSSDHFLRSETESALDLFDKHFDGTDGKPSMPFGSSGSKRCCPAINYSKLVLKQIITELLTKFQLKSIDSDLMTKQLFGIYSRSEEEIWITIEKRKAF